MSEAERGAAGSDGGHAQVVVRRLDRPGDLGGLVMAHGEVYAQDFGWESSFEAPVAGIVADYAGVSKQAISQQVAFLERNGYVAVGPDPRDSRAKVVRLTEHGRSTRDVCRPLFGTVQQRWERRYGRAEIRQLRAALEAVVGQLDDGLPHYPSP